MLKLAGIVLLVLLILVGALLPLKYTARMQLPERSRDPSAGDNDGGNGPHRNRSSREIR
jgi:hypothetical protein